MKLARPHEVVRQTGHSEEKVCAHLFDTTAELHAHWLANRESESGVFYVVRRVDGPRPRYDLVHDLDDARREAVAEDKARTKRLAAESAVPVVRVEQETADV